MKNSNICFIVFLFLLAACSSEQKNDKISIIPLPKEIIKKQGQFSLTSSVKISITDNAQMPIANQLQHYLRKATSYDFEITTNPVTKDFIAFQHSDDLANEVYSLDVTEKGITIKASSKAGFVYGLSSLKQLFPLSIESNPNWTIPAMTINDAPRFVWRGLMLDLSRHFFEKEYILKTIDRLALLKMNTLHLHLVDDQGWRIEIKKYPKLTEIGAWRVDREAQHWNAREPQQKGEKATYGGFLTQEDIKEIVAYATDRGVNIIPEIEMPAHVSAAIAAYPELSCQNKAISVPPGGLWPITDIYCAGDDKVFTFLEDILNEIIPLFPAKYIHIGGDEATKTNWAKCKKCKRRMHQEHLKSVEELQSYFIKRMEKFINSKGKILLGWDEILEGGLAPNATVMSWRGVKGGLEASAQGHDVVMTPGTHCYLDHYQGNPDSEPLAIGGYTTLSKVYEFDPVVDSMSVEQKKHVLGGQANLWAEYIPNEKQSEYMLYPRLAALAETLWSPKKLRNKKDFFKRILPFMNRMDMLGINYSKSSFDITETVSPKENGTLAVTLHSEFEDFEIRYAINDETLSNTSKCYTKPLIISEATTLKAATFCNGKQLGKTWKKHFDFHKAVAAKVNYNTPYSQNYQGQKEMNLVNVMRGSKNFHDGQWQAWLDSDMEVTLILKKPTEIQKVIVGSMENQGQHIFYPTQISVDISTDGKQYIPVAAIHRDYAKSGTPELKDFELNFKPTTAKFIKVKATNVNKTPFTTDTWLFVDEIIIG